MKKSSDGKKEEEPEGEGEGESNTGLIVIISILSIATIAGGIAAFFIIRKYKSKSNMIEAGKATSMTMLGNEGKDKLVESQTQIDPL